jgi:hypothetical protein
MADITMIWDFKENDKAIIGIKKKDLLQGMGYIRRHKKWAGLASQE